MAGFTNAFSATTLAGRRVASKTFRFSANEFVAADATRALTSPGNLYADDSTVGTTSEEQ